MAFSLRKLFGSEDEQDYNYAYANVGAPTMDAPMPNYQNNQYVPPVQADSFAYQSNQNAYMQSVPNNSTVDNMNGVPPITQQMGVGNNPSESRISLIEPQKFSDAKSAAQQLMFGEAVIVNLGSIDKEQSRRVIDFLSGAIFSVEGTIERISNDTFLLTPRTFEINGRMSTNFGPTSR